MKYLVTIHDQVNLVKLLNFSDGVIVGHERFGTRLTTSFHTKSLIEIANQVKSLEKEVFLMANQMMTDQDLESFSSFLDEFDLNLFNGVIVADLGAMVLLHEKGFGHKAVYNPETLATNAYDFNFLDHFQALGVYAAKEITLSDLETIGQEKKVKMFMVGHGHLNMFYSKRQLIKNYENYLGEDLHLHKRQDLKIIEEKRADEPYPIFEDEAGTHVFRSHVMHAFNYIKDLEKFLDYFVIDTIFKDDDYGLLVSKMYQLKCVDLKESIQETYHEVWDEGFFFKKTIYKSKGDES